MTDKWVCPSCGLSEHSIPVWEDKRQFVVGGSPDYIGCTARREMVANKPTTTKDD